MSMFHSRFGPVAVANIDMKNAFMQHVTAAPGTPVRVFTTGPLRFEYYKAGGKTAPHARADATLAEVATETNTPIDLVYLTNIQEALYGMQTMLKYSKGVLDNVIVQAGVTDERVGIVHSGTTSFQVGDYNRTTGEVSNLNSFDYGTNNPDVSGAFEKLCAWFMASPSQLFFSFGSEGYAVSTGKIATNRRVEGNELHGDLDPSTRAFAAAQRTMSAVHSMGKTYFIPERKAFEVKTSATLALRELYPEGRILDWGGGQVKDEETGLSVKVSQTVLFD